MTGLRDAQDGTTVDVLDRVEEKTRGRLRSYLSSRDDWNQSASLKSLTEHAVRDYEHRALVELLQNAHDAQAPGDRAGRVLIRLDEDEEAHGVLYVANSGRGLSDSNFDAITDIARSDKRPEEGIGNKGIGFKSVLQLSRRPEVFSLRHDAPDPEARGYCFGFAADDDIARALEALGHGADDVERLTEDVVRDVFPLCLPAPRPDLPEAVRQLFASGYVTVVRLPLTSAETADDARTQIEQLTDGPPVLLFLRRVAELVVETVSGETASQSVLLRTEADHAGSGPATVVRVELGYAGTWALAEQAVPEALSATRSTAASPGVTSATGGATGPVRSACPWHCGSTRSSPRAVSTRSCPWDPTRWRRSPRTSMLPSSRAWPV
ncbi:Histidine kinase-, DNA gyrase B-, and HSP90-like ATPase [Geodermatophilus saharensis]|uniref:Histidine kinase-, DNA gyrase B-, and HSP90-like ATPase n=1 Tax=Geodermatophilus saharensis TaxID=1137994 RepID=A0A239EF46_9ACTN|nr:ATP-binding protein [Geodermatophilus saharensis]SNS43237.1 Histidine kinase-, DNA gyrase B-, and HSP90-like ATPase [Geodermatophilus saharensis]